MRIVNINFLLLECMTEIILWKIYGLVKPWACSSPLKARHKEALKVVVGGGDMTWRGKWSQGNTRWYREKVGENLRGIGRRGSRLSSQLLVLSKEHCENQTKGEDDSRWKERLMGGGAEGKLMWVQSDANNKGMWSVRGEIMKDNWGNSGRYLKS